MKTKKKAEPRTEIQILSEVLKFKIGESNERIDSIPRDYSEQNTFNRGYHEGRKRAFEEVLEHIGLPF